MSGLVGLLAGQVPPGVHLWRAALDVVDVAKAVRGAEWNFGYVDGWATSTRREVLDTIGTALGFPGYYGRNLDALADCLADVSADTVLLWDGWGPLASEDERGFGLVLEVLADRTAQAGGSRFNVLLRGSGPDLPHVPVLD